MRERIDRYINEQYGVEAEFPWDRDDTSAVYRHRDNKKWFALIIAVLFVVFIVITCINIKEQATVDMETPSVGAMFKALLSNDQAMTIVIAIVLINTSIYITSNLVIYFFKYDFGTCDPRA